MHLITFIGLCLGGIPTMIFAEKYTSNLKTYCSSYMNEFIRELLHNYNNTTDDMKDINNIFNNNDTVENMSRLL